MKPTNRSALIRALQNPSLYDHPIEHFEVLETHISWVLLTGPYAYKIKKPVNLGFVDFSTLETRRFFCFEELRLNRRLAPQLYLDVITITRDVQAPMLNGCGPPIEYAVKMRQFPQGSRLDLVLAQGELQSIHLDQLAQEIASFHGQIDVASEHSPFGTPEIIHRSVTENFEQIPSHLLALADRTGLERVRAWMEQEYVAHWKDFTARKDGGYIKECHGDLHLGNMTVLNDRVTVFDCIEFNENLRWIDVMSEVAFLVMDLEDRGRSDLADRFLNAYLEQTGDYVGLSVLRFYQVYRAMVRAKVACIRLGQCGLTEQEKKQIQAEFLGYLALAERFTQPSRPAILITHGLSGSGKTTISQLALECLGAIRMRSDVERKRLVGLTAETRSGASLNAGIYSEHITEATYQRLEELTRTVIKTGLPVIVDATFLQRRQRDAFHHLAERLRVPFLILDVQTSEPVLRSRVSQREQDGRDASEANVAVLEQQLAHRELLGQDEQPHVLSIDSEQSLEREQLKAAFANTLCC